MTLGVLVPMSSGLIDQLRNHLLDLENGPRGLLLRSLDLINGHLVDCDGVFSVWGTIGPLFCT